MNIRKNSTMFFRLVYLGIVLVLLFFLFKGMLKSDKEITEDKPLILQPKENVFGFIDDSLDYHSGTVNRDETLSDILDPYYLEKTNITDIAKLSKDIFDVRKIRTGNIFHLYTAGDSISTLKFFVYEKDPVNFVVYDLSDSIDIYSGEKKVTTIKNTKTAIIKSSLYEALLENNASIELVIRLSQIFAWQIDFYHLQEEDNFKVIYEEEYVDSQMVGIGKVLGAYFSHYGKDYYAVPFIQDSIYQYFDENGNSLRKAFLKTPIEFARISSRYSSRRLHPILKTYRPHYGVDYAAPTGTSIRTVGDGTVEAVAHSKGNGNYVKVRHNSVYTTMYLHMSRFGKGIKKGTKVKQGQVIGYVGSTGLATAPHLHFIFYLNGSPVDPLKIEIPPSHPVKEELRNDYEIHKKLVMDELQKIDLSGNIDEPPA